MRAFLYLLAYLPALLLVLPAFAWSVIVWGIVRHRSIRERHPQHARVAAQVLYAWDQLLNAKMAGDPDETLSSRLSKARERCVLCRGLCWMIDRIDPDHCARAVERDRGAREEVRL